MIKNEKGQSTIEFILVFVFVIGFVFLFTYSAINYATGYVVHYVTFMSARTFQSYETSQQSPERAINDAAQKAIDVFNRYGLDNFGIKTDNIQVYKPTGGQLKIHVGVTATYTKPLTLIKSIGGNLKATYHSEAFLGKEPVRIDCVQQICNAMGINQCPSNDFDVTLFDNGC